MIPIQFALRRRMMVSGSGSTPVMLTYSANYTNARDVNGEEIHTEIEEKDITIDRMNTAGIEAMQSLNAESL